ncbi:ABC transporter substrate-binding protein [Skermanella stibiiresistens SB22]|uniref:ABC transporter substrate-binding protein n=1 Tax=Skermanella stibiiresistens SB22 TaxID=1385369 RepID=W9H6B9_9PROT|nr:ABC transporter substrate-binding protein [Skermanella stibiiresistens]EWY39308.1 ABC transporter substrate-binding protein [Skermanella stibiiresistens SB22]
MRNFIGAAAGLIGAAAVSITVAFTASAALAASGKLVVYTSQLEADAQQTVDEFKKLNPGVEVEWTRSGTTDLMNKLRAEFQAGSPQPDVLLIADAVTMESLKRDGRLAKFEAAPVAAYQKDFYDADLTYFGTKLITTGIAYNKNAKMKPTSWADLTKPEAKNLVSMPSPLYSGAAAIHMAALKEVPGLGMKYYEALHENGAVAVRGNGGVMTAVAGGEKLYGVLIDYLPIREGLKGSPVEFVFPTDGVSAVSEPVAILSTARNPEAAQAFVSYLLSRQGQELASSQGFLPAHPDVAPPKGFPKLTEIKVLPLDNAKALAEDQANKMAFADLFGG